MELRAYQSRSIIDLLDSFRSGNKRTILCGCTGYGKTIVGAEIIRRSIDKGKNVLWLADRKELIWQARERFDSFGIGERVGVIMAGEDSALEKPVQVASVMTYHRRLQLDDLQWNKWFHKADLIIYDECHGSLATVRKDILKLYKDIYLLGLSATPGRSDKAALGDIYQDIIMGATIRELTDLGFLVPARYFGAKEQPDLKGVNTVMGEWDKKELGKRVDRPKLVGDILENWLRIADGRQTIIFATNVSHSKHIKEVFSRKGINIEHVDAHTPRDERMEILSGLQSGRINVVTNCGVYVEGVDVPSAAVCVLAKPVRFIGRFIQMGGRVLRPYPGKTEAVIIDHACCIGPPHGHGFLDDPIEWTLEGKKIVAKVQTRKKEKTILTCDYCSTLHTGARCPNCGHEIKSYGKKIEALDSELSEISRTKDKKEKYKTQEKHRWWSMLEYERRRLGKSDSWLLAQYKSKFGTWPMGVSELGPTEPDQAVKGWLVYQRIRYLKSKQARREGASA
jgi:superfamily II DNA or RNA helicase